MNGPYFKTHRGLRQADQLSPLLFNLVGDALAHILNKAKEKKHLTGLAPHLVPGGLTQLQFVDDTILFLEYDEQNITNLKFLLYCFEWLTCLKINYHKSKVVVLGFEKEEQIRVSNMLNCQVGILPLTY